LKPVPDTPQVHSIREDQHPVAADLNREAAATPRVQAQAAATHQVHQAEALLNQGPQAEVHPEAADKKD
jgi:hypothetical protein